LFVPKQAWEIYSKLFEVIDFFRFPNSIYSTVNLDFLKFY